MGASEEHHRKGVFPLLLQLVVHPLDGCLEEESHEMLVGSVCANMFERSDIFRTVLHGDNQQRMRGL